MDFDPQMLDQLDQWIRTKGGRVQVKLINEFYQKNAPLHKNQLHNRLHLLADCNASKVHLVGNAYNSAEYLELKHLGSKPFRPSEVVDIPPAAAAAAAVAAPVPAPITLAPLEPFPKFVQQNGYQSALVRSPGVVRAVLEKWRKEYDVLSLDFKGIIHSGGKIALIQIATMDRLLLVVDMLDNPRLVEDSGLRAYLEDANYVKVILNSARSSEAVRAIWGVRLAGVFDLTCSFVITELGRVPSEEEYANYNASLVRMVRTYGIYFPHANKPDDTSTWFKRPLTAAQLLYAACSVVYNCELYANIIHQAKRLGLEQACFEESAVFAASLYNKPVTMQFGANKQQQQHVAKTAAGAPPPPPSLNYEPVGNKIDWTCVNCKAANLAKHTLCSLCKTPKPKAKFLVPANANAVAAAPSIATAVTTTVNNKENLRERQIEKLKEVGLTAHHCYFFHVENRCFNEKPGKTCGYIHDHEFKALQARELANKKPAPAPMPAPAPASREQMDARRLQELEDEALERALQESLRFEEERVERQRREQEEQIARYQAEAAQRAEKEAQQQRAAQAQMAAQQQRAALEQAQLAAQQRAAQEQAKMAAQQRAAFEQAQALQRQAVLREQELDHMQYLFQQQQFAQQQQQQNYAFNFPQPTYVQQGFLQPAFPQQVQARPAQPPLPPGLAAAPIAAAAAAPSLAQSSANNASLFLAMEVAQIGKQVGISEQYFPILLSCAQAAGAQSELKGVNLFKFSLSLKNSDMPLTEQKKFVTEVHARITGKQ